MLMSSYLICSLISHFKPSLFSTSSLGAGIMAPSAGVFLLLNSSHICSSYDMSYDFVARLYLPVP